MFNRQTSYQDRKLFIALLLIACASLLINACSKRSENAAHQPSTETREVTDEIGRRVRVPARVERIVSLAPNLTEIVYAVGAGNRLVGDTEQCDYPAEAKQVAKVGDTIKPSIERIVALHPQIILVSTASQLEAFTKQLDEQRIAVFVTDPHDLEGILRSIQTLGDLFNEHERAANVVKDLRARTSAVEEAVKDKKPIKVFFQISAEPLYTAGKDSFITDLIRRAGGQSVTADVPGAWPRYSDETAMASQPDAVIIAEAEGNREIAAALKNSPAARNGRVYKINADYVSRPGPRLVEGLERIARALHPEAFGK
ncbi:MAG: cobalamin-binding protein [Pyrinomonadaceae bacterium]